MPALPSEEEDTPAREGGAPALSDQATQQQQYNNLNPGERTNNQGYREPYSNNQYSQTHNIGRANSDPVHTYKTSQHVGSAYTNSQFSVSNPGYNYAVDPYRERESNQRSQQNHRHRHHRSRHSRSYKHQVIVQTSPEKRYDLQAQAGTPGTSFGSSNLNQPHIISALTPEGQRRYQYASHRSQSGIYPSQGGYRNQGQRTSYIQPLAGQAGYNPNLGVQGPSLNTWQYGSYYQSINRGSYSDPITLGRAPLNDQISLNLPDTRITNQIENVNSINDYSWRISGFTGCTHTCGGGKYSVFFNSLSDCYSDQDAAKH